MQEEGRSWDASAYRRLCAGGGNTHAASSFVSFPAFSPHSALPVRARLPVRVSAQDMTQVNLDGVLPSATIMVVSVTGSTTNGQPLPEGELQKVSEACDRALELDGALARHRCAALLRAKQWRSSGVAAAPKALIKSQHSQTRTYHLPSLLRCRPPTRPPARAQTPRTASSATWRAAWRRSLRTSAPCLGRAPPPT